MYDILQIANYVPR